MRKWLILLLLAGFAAPASASVTAFSATLKRSDGTVPKVFLRLSIVNCGTYNPYVSGDHVIANPDGSFDLFPNTTTGVISVNVDDEASIVCGISTGVSYYHIATYQGDQTTTTARRKITECDYDITGGSFNMNTATCKAAGSVTAPSLALQKVQNEGSDLSPTRGKINFFNGLKATDNSGSQRDDVTLNLGQKVVDGTTYANIQAAITAASTTGYVVIPANYAGSDVYTNPNSIQIIDLRGKPNRQRGYINVLTDCGLKGDGSTDDYAAAQACFNAYPSWRFYFPPTKTDGSCSYMFNATLKPTGEATAITGGASGYKNNSTQEGGTVLCWAAGVTGIELDLTGQNCSSCSISDISIMGSENQGHLQTPTNVNIPASLPQYVRSISTIQRTGNVLTVVTSALAAGGEALTQQVGSTVKISGVVGDTTMNGLCVVSTLTGTNTFGENATGFTCPQNGSDAGPFGAVGTVGLPSTGASTADGIRICTNFAILSHITVANFGRHGINADSLAADAMCPSNFSDDLVLENSIIVGNQASGFYCKGVDCNAGFMLGNAFYYNTLWGVEDQSSLGNTWVGNQISNNGSGWATSTTPTTKAISTISRTLASNSSTVTVVLSVADINLKLGSCVVIAGVTDTSFNTTAGQCFFITSYTDSTHFQYIQPGAPSNASSSGGTSRMAKFSEVYLTAGVDSGAVKVATQSSTYSQSWLSNYVEGGQDCKFSTIVVSIGGANMPGCVSTSTWKPVSIFQNPTNNAQTTSLAGFYAGKDANTTLSLIPGKAGGTVRDFLFRWYNNNTSGDGWGLQVTPSGTNGSTGQWILGTGTAGSVQRRISLFGSSNAGGITRISSESTGAVQINNDANSGTGGFTVCNGGASPTCPASSSIGSDFSFFGPYFKSSTTNPASAGSVRLAKTDAINFRNNANGADVNGISLNASDQVQCGGSAGCVDSNSNKFSTIIASGTSALGTSAISATTCATVVTTAATNTATTDSIEWAFNAAPGTGYTSGVHVLAYPTSGNVNFLVCNPTAGSLTPAAATLNWRVIR